MASPSSKGAARLWPGFSLNWLNKAAYPSITRERIFQEYIAGIGMIQVNEDRRQMNLPPFKYATIITGIHQSESDHYPHATLAAATSSMRKASNHVVVHARVNTNQLETAKYMGSEVFTQNLREDFKALRDSYLNPVPARASLAPTTDKATPVGHAIADGVSQWYIVDEETEELVYIGLNGFFRAGEGDGQHLRFWNPLKKEICRAEFLGNEQPQPPSPDPLPSNLETAVSDLSIAAPGPSDGPTAEWVTLQLKLDKKTSKPVHFITEAAQEKRTGWEMWEATEDIHGPAYLFRDKTGNEYWAQDLPGD